ncbi:MAG: hypothetical protein IIC74_11880 [Bacteroidetes bacterium]|nr:hypothetical protein [Bacteroidota bacterium]
MKEHTEQHLDKLAKKVIQLSSLESPSLDFTAKIMDKIEVSTASSITVYKPLISKRMWLLISILVIASLSYGIFSSGLENLGWFDKVDFSIISNNKVTEAISGITFSKTLIYAIVSFGLMMCVQIPYLKNYFDKRLEY